MRLVPRGLFDIGSCIGEGKNGKVYLLRLRSTDSEDSENTQTQQTHFLFAGKSYSFNFLDEFRLKVVNEVSIHASLHHRNILPLHACFFDYDRVFFVLDLGFTDFFNFLTDAGPLNEDLARHCLRQVLDVLDYLHKQEIIFSDLKPENLIVVGESPDLQLKLTDFGSAQRTNSSAVLCGTLEYQAPEQKQGRTYTHKIDIYAAGILLYEMLTLQTPPDRPTQTAQLSKFTGYCVRLFEALTATDPDCRLTAAEALQHPFFS